MCFNIVKFYQETAESLYSLICGIGEGRTEQTSQLSVEGSLHTDRNKLLVDVDLYRRISERVG